MLKHDFGRPLSYSSDSKLVDIVREEFYYNSGLNNLVEGVKEIYSGKHRSRNIAMTIAFGSSVVSNLLGAYYADTNNYGHEGIDNTSFWWEILLHGALFAGIYLYYSVVKDKKKLSKALYDLGKLTTISATTTFTLYKWGRNYLADLNMASGIMPELATPYAQLMAFPGYFACVHYALKGLNKLEEYVKDRIDKCKDRIEKTDSKTDEVIKTTTCGKNIDISHNIELNEPYDKDIDYMT